MIGKIFKNDIVSVEKNIESKRFTYKCFNEKGNQLLTYSVDWNLKEIICYDKSLEIDGVIEEVHISSNNLFDLLENTSITLTRGELKVKELIEVESNSLKLCRAFRHKIESMLVELQI